MEDNSLVKWIFSTIYHCHVVVRNDRYGTKRNGRLSTRPGYPARRRSEPPAKIVIDPPLAGPLASGEWRLSNIVLRTCTLRRCSAPMLWLSRRASDTFM